jgi:hypothetical protein
LAALCPPAAPCVGPCVSAATAVCCVLCWAKWLCSHGVLLCLVLGQVALQSRRSAVSCVGNQTAG